MWVESHAVTYIGTPIDDQIRPELLVARASSRLLVARASVLFLELIAFLRQFSFCLITFSSLSTNFLAFLVIM